MSVILNSEFVDKVYVTYSLNSKNKEDYLIEAKEHVAKGGFIGGNLLLGFKLNTELDRYIDEGKEYIQGAYVYGFPLGKLPAIALREPTEEDRKNLPEFPED
jgi:hypothetical protein